MDDVNIEINDKTYYAIWSVLWEKMYGYALKHNTGIQVLNKVSESTWDSLGGILNNNVFSSQLKQEFNE